MGPDVSRGTITCTCSTSQIWRSLGPFQLHTTTQPQAPKGRSRRALSSALERRQTGLFGPRYRFAAVEAPKLSHRAGPTRDRLEDYNI